MSAWPGEERPEYDPHSQVPPAAGYGHAREQTRTQPQAQVQPYASSAPPPPAYGMQAQSYQQVQPHSAALGVVASFFVPGLGSMLNEKVGKGIGILACYIVSVILIFFLVGIILSPIVWIWGMVAANNDAHKWNRDHGILS